ncbi:MAG: helix-turn-helix domain-containing protein [Phycisphaerales bacterium]
MNKELFERLLYEEESPTLDFKKEQYRFADEEEKEKSELLKDILGFANAWRRSEAYILCGVEDIRGGRSNVVGISADNHQQDHSLQQFVNNLTNQPVHFNYEAFEFEGKQVGIFRIAEQIRPIYLKRDYGKLKKNEVYLRRGSSTDPTKPASPEEIAQMRVGSGQPAAELLVEFANVDRDDSLGTSISWDVEFCKMPERETIPDHPRPVQRLSGNMNLPESQFPLMRGPSKNYFRELSDFEFAKRLFRPVRFAVKNVGQVAANKVRIELSIPVNIGVGVLEVSEIPDPPKRQTRIYDQIVTAHVRPISLRNPGEVNIHKNADRFKFEMDFGDLQPGRQILSDLFYIGKKESGDILLSGLVFADNLPKPKDLSLTVKVKVKQTSMSVDDLCSLPDHSAD